MDVSSLRAELATLRNETSARLDSLSEAIGTTWTLFAVVVIFLMQAGFSMLEAGSVREKGVRDILLKNLLDTALGSFAWVLIGCTLAKGAGNAFTGGWPELSNETVTPFDAVLSSHGDDDMGKYMLGFMYAIASATIVSGSIAERTQQRAYMIASSCVTGFLYPVVYHWLWSETGWLSCANPDALLGGAFDFAGGGVVHMTAGVLALVAAKAVGPRRGRFDQLTGRPLELRGHSSVLVVLGTFLLWVGWIGFNIGSVPDITAVGAPNVAARTAVRTTLSASAGLLAAIVVARCRAKQRQVWSLEHACNGLLAGLVSITASAPVVSHWAALLIGAIGGVLYYWSSRAVARFLKVDDVIDAFAVHGVCGMWSLIVVGLTADGSETCNGEPAIGVLAGGDGRLLGAAVITAVSIGSWALLGGFVLFGTLRKAELLRVPDDVEITGIDIVELGRPAYSSSQDESVHGRPQHAAARPISPTETESLAGSSAAGAVASGVAIDATGSSGVVEGRPVMAGDEEGRL